MLNLGVYCKMDNRKMSLGLDDTMSWLLGLSPEELDAAMSPIAEVSLMNLIVVLNESL